MEIGLYQFKHEFRRYLERLVPYFKDVDPNWISASLVPLGLLTAWVYAFAYENSWLYLIGFLLIVLRMIIGTLDGMVAERYQKTSDRGTLINRLCPEFADIALMLAIAYSAAENIDLALWAIGIGWASSYLGLIGLAIGKPIQSVGPVGQTDRLIALSICSILSAFIGADLWMQVFLWWCIFGGLATCGLRLQRQFYDKSSQSS